jgi:hypothetical protein
VKSKKAPSGPGRIRWYVVRRSAQSRRGNRADADGIVQPQKLEEQDQGRERRQVGEDARGLGRAAEEWRAHAHHQGPAGEEAPVLLALGGEGAARVSILRDLFIPAGIGKIQPRDRLAERFAGGLDVILARIAPGDLGLDISDEEQRDAQRDGEGEQARHHAPLRSRRELLDQFRGRDGHGFSPAATASGRAAARRARNSPRRA